LVYGTIRCSVSLTTILLGNQPKYDPEQYVLEEMRRPRVDWMTRADDSILEFLLNEGNRPIRATPAVIQANVDYQISHVRNRIRELHEAGLVQYYDEDRGIYQITDRGRAYLAGEVDADELEK